jgi:hypothetical protein
VYLLNNGPETDFGVYNGANNGQGLTLHTAQVSTVGVTHPGGVGGMPASLARRCMC